MKISIGGFAAVLIGASFPGTVGCGPETVCTFCAMTNRAEVLMSARCKTSCLTSSEEVAYNKYKCALHQTSVEVVVRSGESYTRIPKLEEIVYKWGKIMIGCCERRFIWARYDTGEEHILKLVTMGFWKAEADNRYDSNGFLLPRLLVGKGIKEIQTNAERVASDSNSGDEWFAVIVSESTKELSIIGTFKLPISRAAGMIHKIFVAWTCHKACHIILEVKGYKGFDGNSNLRVAVKFLASESSSALGTIFELFI